MCHETFTYRPPMVCRRQHLWFPLAGLGQTWSGHPRLRTWLYRQPGRAWMAGTSPATGCGVVSSASQTTDFALSDSRGRMPATNVFGRAHAELFLARDAEGSRRDA